MAVRFDNRWQSLIFLSVIGYAIQPILADNDNDSDSVIAEAYEDEKRIPRPREIFSTATIEGTGESFMLHLESPTDAFHESIDDTSMPIAQVMPARPGASWPLEYLTPSKVQASATMNAAENRVENGGPYQERIVGGGIARPGDWPWMVIMFNDGKQWCGGTLIDAKHILTAAHCFYGLQASAIVVHLGDYNTATINEARHIERRVTEVNVPTPVFNMVTLFNDIAIATMDWPVAFTSAIRPIRLPYGSQQYTGKMATVIGWGSTVHGGLGTTILKQASTKIISNSECQSMFTNRRRIFHTYLCVSSLAGDSSCHGDSGGPLMVNEGGRWIQVGIVSFGYKCGSPQHPTIYTRVTEYMPWIRKNLR